MSNHLSRRTILAGGLAAAAIPALGGTATAQHPPLRIGVLLNLKSAQGQRKLLGIEHEAARVADVELLTRDTEGRVKVAVEQAQAFARDKVDAIIGTSAAKSTNAVLDIAQNAGIPVMVPGGGVPPEFSYAFRSGATFEQVSHGFGRAVAQAGFQRVAALGAIIPGSPDQWEPFRELLAGHGADLTAYIEFPTSISDLVTPLLKLVRSGPDAMLFTAVDPFNVLVAKAVRTIGWNGHLYCSPATANSQFLKCAGAVAEGVRVVAPWITVTRQAPETVPNRSVMREFGESFQRQHGEWPDAHNAYGADAVRMLHRAYEGHRDRARARSTLETMVHTGVTGQYEFSPENHAGLDDDALTTVVVRNGAWVSPL